MRIVGHFCHRLETIMPENTGHDLLLRNLRQFRGGRIPR
jgi:hypothetical protein